MIGRWYLWRGQVWAVQCRWSGKGPRNVLLENVWSGEIVIRPFRGLRRVRVSHWQREPVQLGLFEVAA